MMMGGGESRGKELHFLKGCLNIIEDYNDDKMGNVIVITNTNCYA